MIVWIDFSDHGYSDTHTVPYWNEVQWNAQYPIGGYKTDHRLDSNKNVRKRVAKEWENYRQKIERGITEKRIFYSLVTGLSDILDSVLQIRKAVVEGYPVLNWTERKL